MKQNYRLVDLLELLHWSCHLLLVATAIKQHLFSYHKIAVSSQRLLNIRSAVQSSRKQLEFNFAIIRVLCAVKIQH